MGYHIACDIGGTFTDIIAIDDAGTVLQYKTDTTTADLIKGLKEAVRGVADRSNVDTKELLGKTDRFVNGTTIVTNNILELDGARTGLLTTKGFRDTLRIANSPRGSERDPVEQTNVPDIVPRECIKEIPERVDYKGEIIVELDEDELREAVTELVEEEDIESLAVCYLWSFQNASHETRTKEIVEEMYPELYVTTSNEIHPKIQEYERMAATVLNAYTAPDVARYVDRLEHELGEMGLDPSVIALMQGAGGSTTPKEAKETPIRLIDSGPVGGVIGAQKLGRKLDRSNVIAADMGGTSFECAIIEDDSLPLTEQMEVIREVQTGLRKVDTHTIGAGGGSVAWVDERGAPQIGPMSVGADPGPACYDRGGTEATLTDAALVLGLLRSDAFLGGRRTLERARAQEALETEVAEKLGQTVEKAAASVYGMAINSMSNAIRSVTVQEGRDPREFTLFAYGGALPMFAADISAELGITDIVIPSEASVFSAYGLLQVDDMRTYSKSVFWDQGDPVDEINETLAELESRIRNQASAAGFDDSALSVEREGRFKFKGQLFDHPVSLPDGELSQADLAELTEQFPELYEAEYGSGTAWVESPITLQAVRVTGTTTVTKPSVSESEVTEKRPEPISARSVYLPFRQERKDVDVYDSNTFLPGSSVTGPAILEEETTTVFVPKGFELASDKYHNYVLSQLEGDTADQAATPLMEVLAE